MMCRSWWKSAIGILGLLAILGISARGEPVGTAFSYQGKLINSQGTPCTGTYDLQFKLYDALTDGNQIGSTITKSGVSVSGGLFNVTLDFGAGAFGDQKRWLEVSVGSEPLLPRTEITSAPSAIFAQSVPWGGVSGAPSSLLPSGSAGGDLSGSYPNPALASAESSLAKVSGGAMAARAGRIGTGTSSPAAKLDVQSSASSDMVARFQGYSETNSVDQEQTASNTTISYAEFWQSFTAGDDGILTAVEMSVCCPYPLQYAILRIWDGVGLVGSPYTQQVSIPQPVTQPQMTKLTLSFTYPVLKGHSYTFELLSPSGAPLLVSVSTTNPYAGGFFFASGSLDMVFRTYITHRSLATALCIQPSSLNVGIGTDSPTYKLHVNGSVAGVGAYNQLSDRRYKSDVRGLSNALDSVLKLRGVSFDWRRDQFRDIQFPEGRQIGLIAQEVEKVVPQVVSKDSEGHESVAYSGLVPVLIEAIKEQQKRIETLQALNSRMEMRLKKLEKRSVKPRKVR